ncbi:nitrite reductase [Paenibacillus sp. FSL W8-0186]|uniref:nitrite reductase n=1 Tax=Paenibacillus sp. FSL W8-0186 TaxID=2921709 RepID=UPI0030CBB663
MEDSNVKIAINGGIGFGSKLNAKQLAVITKYMHENDELELTTFQQLYITVPESDVVMLKEEFEQVGLACYPVGNFVKSLRTCNFCKGAEEEGMPVAVELNRILAGRPVPFTLRPAYTGCLIGCGEPLIHDIGVMKVRGGYNLYIGGKSKGADARVGVLLLEEATPEELYGAVEQIIEIYSGQGKRREPFAKFVDRYGFENIYHAITGSSPQ